MVHLHLLTPRSIRTTTGTISHRASTLFGIAAYLIIERGKPVPRRRLLQLFWPNRPEPAARHPLRESLRKLRRKGIPITGDEHHVILAKDAATIDVEELAHADIGDLATHDLTVLAGYDPHISDAYSDWLDDVRTRYTAHALRYLLDAIDYTKTTADWPMMHQLAEHALTLDPANLHALSAINHARRILRGLYAPPTTITPARVRDTPSPITLAPLGGHAAEQDTILVGRTTDITTLTNALNRARRNQGNTITLHAPPGTGKSRLLRELTHIAHYDEAAIISVTTPLAYPSAPLSIWHDFITRLLRTPGAGGCDPHTITTLNDFIANPTAFVTDSTALTTATADLISAVAYEQPLVIIMEDAHRMDAASQTILHTITTKIPHEPVFCVIANCTSPPNHTPNENGPAATTAANPLSITNHQLDPLTPTFATQHFEAYRAGIARRMPEELRAWCIHIANGNPYFAEELLNHWSDTPHEPITDAPPSSLTTLINIRLHRLDPISRRTLQSCATLGFHATLPRLARLVGASEWRVAAATAELRTKGFMTVAGPPLAPTHQRLRCRHDLIAEHTLALLSPEERRTLHDQAAAQLKRDLTSTNKNDQTLAMAYTAHYTAAQQD